MSDAPIAARAVVSDDGVMIRLTIYTEADLAVPVELAPVRAVALAGELIRAAVPKLGAVSEENSATMAPKRRRGGDPLAEKRQQRGQLLTELTAIQSGSTESDRIRAAISKLERYAANGWPHEREKPDDTGNRERDLLRKTMKTGLPIVGARQHRAIVRAYTKK